MKTNVNYLVKSLCQKNDFSTFTNKKEISNLSGFNEMENIYRFLVGTIYCKISYQT